LILAAVSFAACDKSDLEIEKERLQKEAAKLKNKIDSTAKAIDEGKKSLDSLAYRIKKDSSEIDSLMKKINPLKKLN